MKPKNMIRIVAFAALVLASGASDAQVPLKLKLKALKLDSTLKQAPVDRKSLVVGPTTRRITDQEHYVFGTVLDGDTIPLYQLRAVNVYMSGMLLTPKEIKSNSKLIRNVRLMLPYAQEGKRRLDALEIEIAALPKKQRKAAIKEAEQKLLADYKEDLSKYSFSQGLVLIKLIDRETNRTAYNIVGELRGTFRAGLYQTFAKLFGYNLKTQFDPKHNSKDDLIDRIVRSIERGQL